MLALYYFLYGVVAAQMRLDNGAGAGVHRTIVEGYCSCAGRRAYKAGARSERENQLEHVGWIQSISVKGKDVVALDDNINFNKIV